jgi:hypothetical protein
MPGARRDELASTSGAMTITSLEPRTSMSSTKRGKGSAKPYVGGQVSLPLAVLDSAIQFAPALERVRRIAAPKL